MDAKYQKYYNGLKGKDFSSCVSKYQANIGELKSKLTSAEGAISPGSWSEKGIEIVKQTVFPTLKTSTDNIISAVNTLSTVASKVSELVSKLESLEKKCKEYDNCSQEDEPDRKNALRNEVKALEGQVDSIINAINGISIDIPEVSVQAYSSAMSSLEEMNSIQYRKQEFLGDVNDTSKYYIDKTKWTKAKELLVFDNKTGKILKEGDTIYMKPGETRILTVKLPNNAGAISKLVRTTADGDSAYRSGNYVHAVSDVNPDPNKIDYVNYKEWSNHWPQGVNLHTNHYDWVVTAKAEGTVQISQTCEYQNTNGNYPKGMVDLNVVVKNS